MCASKEDFHHKRMQSEDTYLLLLLFLTLDVCQLLDDSVLNGLYELFSNYGEFGFVKSGILVYVWLSITG